MIEAAALFQIILAHLPQSLQMCAAVWPLVRAHLARVLAVLRPARSLPRHSWRWYDERDFTALRKRK